LKAPFRLADGRTEAQLRSVIAGLAERVDAFTLPRLSVESLDGFLALQTLEPCRQIHQLADACVIEIDGFRRPAGKDELSKRRAAGLSARQDQLLIRFGYRFVLDQFRFHMTLTDRLLLDEAALLRPFLAKYLAPALAVPVRCEDLCLFVEERP